MRSELGPRTSQWLVRTPAFCLWIVIAMIWSVACGPTTVAQETPTLARARNDLQGCVTDAAGRVLQDAHVFIYTAKPKVGPAYLCPSCYPDCGKRVTTDANGRFTINALDPSLLFRILVVHPGYLSKFVADIDPAQGLVTVAMETLDLSDIPSERILQGRVVNGLGEPVVGASVTVEGWASKRGSRTWGPAASVMLTPVAVSNLQGEFSLVAKQDLLSVELQIHCRNYAQSEFHEISFGQSRRDFQLAPGGMVIGRLIHNGRPLAGRTMLVSSENRSTVGNFTRQSIATDPNGCFTFVNLPVDLVYHVTASMESIRQLGITPLTRVAGLKNGQFRDIGDLVIQPGLMVSGKVQLSDGKPIPADSMIFLNHEKIWGGQSQILGPDGTFKFSGMHPGQIGCPVRIPGYRPAKLNRSYYDLNGGELKATLTDSVTNLVLLMEPGERDWNGIGVPRGMPRTESPEMLTFSGIEPLPAERLAAQVRVRAIDAESGEILDACQVTPGWQFDSDQEPVWHVFQERTVHPADPPLEVEKRSGPAFIQVVAEGFLPVSIPVADKTGKTIAVPLKRGQGVRGLVLQPDGDPAAAAQVVMLRMRDNGNPPGYGFISISHGRFGRETGRQHHLVKTDPAGAFTFPPAHDVHPLYIAHETGFAVVEKPEAGEPLSIRLQPWASISGDIQNYDEKGEWFVQVKARRPRLPGDPPSKRGFLSSLFRGFKQAPAASKKPSLLPTIANLVPPTEMGKFDFDRIPPGRWWVVLSRKASLPGETTPHGAFTLKAVAAIEVEAKSGVVASATLAGPPP